MKKYINIDICMYVCMYMYGCIYIHVSIYIYICINNSVNRFRVYNIYIYIHIHISTGEVTQDLYNQP